MKLKRNESCVYLAYSQSSLPMLENLIGIHLGIDFAFRLIIKKSWEVASSILLINI